MSEIAKCSPGTHSLGCYLRKSPPSVKLIVALLSSMMPSSSALKRKIQSKYFQEPKSLVSNDLFRWYSLAELFTSTEIVQNF